MNNPFRFHPSVPQQNFVPAAQPAARTAPTAIARPRLGTLPVHPAFPCAQEIAKAPDWIAAYAQARIADIAAKAHVALAAFEPTAGNEADGRIALPWMQDANWQKAQAEARETYAFLQSYYPALANCFLAWCWSIGFSMPAVPVQTFNSLAGQ